jgi:hypothetical protein
MESMKIVVYANVNKDWKERIQTPYGITQFRSYISRSFITSDLPYTHPSVKAVETDIIIWAFKDNDIWYLIGDGYVRSKYKVKGKTKKDDCWEFYIESARLYPRSVSMDELSFGPAKKNALNVGFEIKPKEYMEVLEKAGTPLIE